MYYDTTAALRKLLVSLHNKAKSFVQAQKHSSQHAQKIKKTHRACTWKARQKKNNIRKIKINLSNQNITHV
jgi:hypothetical protein